MMRYVIAFMVMLISGSAYADEISDQILAGQAVPYSVNLCTENSTQRSGVCALFKRSDSPDSYLVFIIDREIQWIKRIPAIGETELVYVIGIAI